MLDVPAPSRLNIVLTLACGARQFATLIARLLGTLTQTQVLSSTVSAKGRPGSTAGVWDSGVFSNDRPVHVAAAMCPQTSARIELRLTRTARIAVGGRALASPLRWSRDRRVSSAPTGPFPGEGSGETRGPEADGRRVRGREGGNVR